MEPDQLICARVLSRDVDTVPDTQFFTARIKRAAAIRDQFFPGPFYRLVYGDSDGLSGLVVDRFGDYLVVQANTSGIERYRGEILTALDNLFNPLGVLWRADSRQRQAQGTASGPETVLGSVPERVELIENGVPFLAPLGGGQKTGWFYDHRDNRAAMCHHAGDRQVLDVFSYVGGWGIQAGAAGAAGVLCVDSSEEALAGVLENARHNDLEERVSCAHGPAEQVMAELAQQNRLFDLIIVDPPALIQRRRDHVQGSKAYRRINGLALALLAPGGILISASCSMHLSTEELCVAVNEAALRAGRALRLVGRGTQGADHPVHPAIPETAYLKSLTFIAD